MTRLAFATNPHTHREPWLNELAALMRPMFAKAGATVPSNVRISVGWPSSRALSGNGGSRTIGQCWYGTSSKDGSHEIFISPVLDDPMKVAGVLAHEMVHAVCGPTAGHKAPFKKLATAIGLVGKMTSTSEGDTFKRDVAPMLAQVGPYPHASLDGSTRKKQSTRLIKCQCEECGYTVRTTQKWLDDVGAPHCPNHGEMEVC